MKLDAKKVHGAFLFLHIDRYSPPGGGGGGFDGHDHLWSRVPQALHSPRSGPSGASCSPNAYIIQLSPEKAFVAVWKTRTFLANDRVSDILRRASAKDRRRASGCPNAIWESGAGTVSWTGTGINCTFCKFQPSKCQCDSFPLPMSQCRLINQQYPQQLIMRMPNINSKWRWRRLGLQATFGHSSSYPDLNFMVLVYILLHRCCKEPIYFPLGLLERRIMAPITPRI